MLSEKKASSEVEGSATYAIMSVAVVLAAPLLFGMMIGSSGPSIDTMKNGVIDYEGRALKLPVDSQYVVFTDGQASFFTSLLAIGAMIGALVGGWFVKLMGYRFTFLLTVPLLGANALLMTFFTHYLILFTARVFAGIAIGINSAIAPAYINDASPTHLRGMLGASNQLAVTVGILLVYILGSMLVVDGGEIVSTLVGEPNMKAPDRSFCNWRTMAFSSLFPLGVFAIGLIFIPESPRWLASKGKTAEARKALDVLRNGHPLSDEIDAITQVATQTPNASSNTWSDLWAARKQVSIGISLQFFQQFAGINAFMFYCTTIMRQAHLPHPEIVSILVMLEQVLVTLLACYLMDVCGRRPLLFAGAGGMAFACFLFAIYYMLGDLLKAGGITIMVYIATFVYIGAFAIGVGAIPWLILGEILPNNVRSTGSSIATTCNWLFAYIITQCIDPVTKLIGNAAVMSIFGTCCIGLIVFTALVIPETKGKTLEEIQDNFAPPTFIPKHIEDGNAEDSHSVRISQLLNKFRSDPPNYEKIPQADNVAKKTPLLHENIEFSELLNEFRNDPTKNYPKSRKDEVVPKLSFFNQNIISQKIQSMPTETL